MVRELKVAGLRRGSNARGGPQGHQRAFDRQKTRETLHPASAEIGDLRRRQMPLLDLPAIGLHLGDRQGCAMRAGGADQIHLDHALAAFPEELLVEPHPDLRTGEALLQSGCKDDLLLGRAGAIETFALRESVSLPQRLADGLLAAEGGTKRDCRPFLSYEMLGFARGVDVPPGRFAGREPRKARHLFGIDADPAQVPRGRADSRDPR